MRAHNLYLMVISYPYFWGLKPSYFMVLGSKGSGAVKNQRMISMAVVNKPGRAGLEYVYTYTIIHMYLL